MIAVFASAYPTFLLAEEQRTSIHFSLKPHICILSKDESQCHDELVIEWKSDKNENISLCLFQESNAIALECWHEKSAGKTQFSSLIDKTTVFELRAETDKTLLASQVFQVIYTQKKYQYSRRNPWSFF